MSEGTAASPRRIAVPAPCERVAVKLGAARAQGDLGWAGTALIVGRALAMAVTPEAEPAAYAVREALETLRVALLELAALTGW